MQVDAKYAEIDCDHAEVESDGVPGEAEPAHRCQSF